MSDPKHEQKSPQNIPDGQSRFLTTRQMPPNEKGFIGFQTIWTPFQKEVEYQTPKTP